MNNSRTYLIILFFLFNLIHASLAQIATGYEVAKWYQFKKAAITYTFDDNTSKQLSVAVPVFDQHDYDVTLFVVTNWGPNWPGMQNASDNGHEIASHSVTHANLSSLDISQQTNELQNSQNTINGNISNASCLTVAYPFCATADLTTTQSFYIAARGCSGVIESATPSDFYNISSIIVGTEGPVKNADNFNTRVNNARNSEGWCVFLMHGIDDDGGYSPIASTEISAHLDYMDANREDFWVGTFLNVVKYIRERNALSITETVINADSLHIEVTDGLDNLIYNRPVTIRRIIPASWQNATIFVDGMPVSYRNEQEGSDYYVIFDVVPDAGEVRIARSGNPLIVFPSQKNYGAGVKANISPNPSLSQFTITLKGNFHYTVYSEAGLMVEEGKGKDTASAGADLSPGTYLIRIEQDNKLVYSAKIIKR